MKNFGSCWLCLTALACLIFSTPSTGQVTFIEKSAEKGVENPGFGRGAAMVDLDGDGRLDMIGANSGANVVYRQLEDGTFEESSAAWGIDPGNDPSWGVLATDFDNDGDPDIYFFVGGFIDVEGFGMSLLEGDGTAVDGVPNRMLRNDLNDTGVFVDVTDQTGDLGALVTGTFGGTAVDYDLDGDLDIFHCDEPADQSCRLMRNDGSLTFTDVSVAAGITELGEFRHVSSGDFNNDGWPDLGVGGSSGANLVYRNNADGTFTEVANEIGLDNPGGNFNVIFVDFDNDGWMDAYVPKYDKDRPPRSRLFMNQGDGTFRNVSDGSGIEAQTDMGHTVADFDRDGYPDLLIGTGGPFFLEFDRLYLLTPDGRGGLLANDVSVSSGLNSGDMSRQHGQAVGDYDDDGDLDIFANNGGPRLLDTMEDGFFWENQGNGNHWVGLDLVGNVSNLPGIGARARVTTTTGRDVHRYRDGGIGFGNTNGPTLFFGLGTDDAIDLAQIAWPSGINQVILTPAVDSRHTVVETGALGLPTAGINSTYTIDLYGPAGQEADVATSDETTTRVVPERGGIGRIAPPIEILSTVTLDGSGRGTAEVQIDDDAGLIGETIYFQVWFHDPGATEGGSLSNLVSVVITE